MANNLVLSSHKQLIDFKGKNLLLADWPISGLELKNIKYEILDSHWKEKNKLEKDYKYLKNYYSVFMKKFYLFLKYLVLDPYPLKYQTLRYQHV